MYETLVMIPDSLALGIGDVEIALRKVFSNEVVPEITKDGGGLRLEWPDFHLEVCLNAAPHVAEEALEMALLASQERKSEIEACKSRLEVSGSNDPEMNYFNDFCLVLQALESLGNVHTFDQGSGEFLN